VNKVYFFILDEEYGGTNISAPSWKEARNIFLNHELYTEIEGPSWCYDKYIQIKGHMCKKDGKIVYTNKPMGELDIKATCELGLNWWSCENEVCGCNDVEILTDDYVCGKAEYRCCSCGEVGIIPYIDR